MASGAGLDRQILCGRRFRRLFRGVYVTADTDVTLPMLIRAAMLTLPGDAVVSHTTAMALYGFDHRKFARVLEFSTNTSAITTHDSIVLHRHRATLRPRQYAGLPVSGADRTFVDCATQLTFVQLVQFGDWLIHRNLTTLEVLTDYVYTRHFDGVRRARRCVAFVRERVESPMETWVRLMIVFARLPEPATNLELFDHRGRFVARLDMAYPRWRVAVEYDGIHHERDARQRQRDRERREAIESLGWRVIVVTGRDLLSPQSTPWRVFHALAAHGYSGHEPVVNATWRQWFSPANP